MIDRLLVHTGDPKTGTSSIQAALQAQAWACDKTTLWAQETNNAVALANSLAAKHSEKRDREFSRVRDWFQQRPDGVGVISSEFFALRNPRQLAQALNQYFPDLPRRTLSYVRPHASRLVSAYGQRLKTGEFDDSMDAFCHFAITAPTFEYNRRFTAWKKIFGEDMILRPFIRSALRGGDVVEDFFFQTLETDAFTLKPLDSVNEGLSVANLSGLRFLQGVFADQDLAQHHRLAIGGALQRKLSEGAATQVSGEKPRLHKAGAELLLTHLRADAEAIDRSFFGGDPHLEQDLLNARDRAAQTAQDFQPETHFSAAQLHSLKQAAERITALIKRQPRAWRQAYQVQIAQRTTAQHEAQSSAHRKNAAAVWHQLDIVTEVLAAPDRASGSHSPIQAHTSAAQSAGSPDTGPLHQRSQRTAPLKRTLVLHIGAHRTATSSLQSYLFQNFDTLQDQGYFYPMKVRRHMRLVNSLFSGERRPREVAADLNKRADSRKKDIHTIILSDEDISMRPDLSVLAKFRKWFDVKVVFTLRRQDSWLESWFFQNIKWQWNPKLSHCTFDEFLSMREDFHWTHYDRYITHLERLFGKDNLILNIHERGQMNGGPIETFCDSIGLTDRAAFHPPVHVNESYSPEISEFMRCLPLDAAQPRYRNVLTKACARIDKALQDGQPRKSERLMPAAQRRAVMAEYEDGNRKIAQRYFNRDALFFDPLPDEDAPLAQMALPRDSYELMQTLVGPLLQELIAHEFDLQEQLSEK